MFETNMGYVVSVIYAVAIWIVGAYVWEWWKNWRLGERSKTDGEDTCHGKSISEESDEALTSAAA